MTPPRGAAFLQYAPPVSSLEGRYQPPLLVQQYGNRATVYPYSTGTTRDDEDDRDMDLNGHGRYHVKTMGGGMDTVSTNGGLLQRVSTNIVRPHPIPLMRAAPAGKCGERGIRSTLARHCAMRVRDKGCTHGLLVPGHLRSLYGVGITSAAVVRLLQILWARGTVRYARRAGVRVRVRAFIRVPLPLFLLLYPFPIPSRADARTHSCLCPTDNVLRSFGEHDSDATLHGQQRASKPPESSPDSIRLNLPSFIVRSLSICCISGTVQRSGDFTWRRLMYVALAVRAAQCQSNEEGRCDPGCDPGYVINAAKGKWPNGARSQIIGKRYERSQSRAD
ncbi:hypothetical protein B0H16DRAFT_1879720 [Mycena metata]|uniref:Uncharacterized protein n=1 Tax=Mycena metata TaxID=1033252 RepID=A0AAD7NV97_9AGAR|nr:hypothetical protein B0H16DRAFT_1879720 [Mycena metata]